MLNGSTFMCGLILKSSSRFYLTAIEQTRAARYYLGELALGTVCVLLLV